MGRLIDVEVDLIQDHGLVLLFSCCVIQHGLDTHDLIVPSRSPLVVVGKTKLDIQLLGLGEVRLILGGFV